MRILQISSAKTFGGGEKHLIDLCRGLDQAGQELFVALRHRNNWEEKLDFLPPERVFHVAMKNSLDIFSARKLAKIMRANDIEIIHAHLARDYPLAGLATRLYPKAKLILSRHVLFPLKSVHKLVLQNVSKVIAISEPTKGQVKKIFPEKKITLIPYGFEIKDFSPEHSGEVKRQFRSQYNIPIDAPLIGTVGELNPLKGQKEFIIAADLILKKFPNACFLSSGRDKSKNQTYFRQLKKLVSDLSLEKNFIWIEWVEQINRLYAALDVFVSASHTESFGLAIAEAMTSGTAVIATETKGAKQLIKDDFSGKLIPFDNPSKLADAVCDLLEDREKRELFIKNAQAFATQNFSLERMISDTENLYKSVIGNW